jgi:acetyl-CoA C-acetyltransferase
MSARTGESAPSLRAARPAREAWIVSAARSAIGRANKGSLVEMRPDDLAASVVRAALAKVPAVAPAEIEDVILGCAQPAGESGYNMARVVALLAGLPEAGGTTVNRYCASSLQGIRMAMHAILAGEGDAFVCAGVETVSRFTKGKSDGMPDTKNPRFADPASGLPDVYLAMGETAERVADREGVTREEMDAFAATSQERAVRAQAEGVFASEIVPITKPDGTVVDRDDGPRAGTTVEKLAKLEPVFRPDGRVTAGNACPLNDGAAAVVVMSSARARELGIRPLARIVSSAVSAINPEIMGLGPIEATRRALALAKLTMADVDLVEINEAFAAQVIPSARALGIPMDKLNVHGGAIALGHPFGMTGARIMTTLLNALARHDGAIGLETMCVGGGQGMAMIVERI